MLWSKHINFLRQSRDAHKIFFLFSHNLNITDLFFNEWYNSGICPKTLSLSKYFAYIFIKPSLIHAPFVCFLLLVREELVYTNRSSKIQSTITISIAVCLLLCVSCDTAKSKAMQHIVQSSKTVQLNNNLQAQRSMPIKHWLNYTWHEHVYFVENGRRLLRTGIRETR